MLRPSYSELMDIIKQSDRLDGRVTSRYTVVLAAAKRARQITNGAHPLTYAPTDRAVSIAVREMSEGKLRVRLQDDMIDGSYERMLKDQYRYRNMVALSKDDLREDLKDNYAPIPYATDDDNDIDFRDPYLVDDEKDEFDDLYEDNSNTEDDDEEFED